MRQQRKKQPALVMYAIQSNAEKKKSYATNASEKTAPEHLSYQFLVSCPPLCTGKFFCLILLTWKLWQTEHILNVYNGGVHVKQAIHTMSREAFFLILFFQWILQMSADITFFTLFGTWTHINSLVLPLWICEMSGTVKRLWLVIGWIAFRPYNWNGKIQLSMCTTGLWAEL